MGFVRRFFSSQREKLSTFFRLLISDYRDVATDTLQSYGRRPAKSWTYTGLLGGGIYSYWTNPTEVSFGAALTEAHLDIANVHPGQRSAITQAEVLRIYGLKETSRLRHLDLVFLSIVWRADFHSKTNSYDAICKHLQPHPLTWLDRVEDVGSWGRWHRLESLMANYDVNEEFAEQFHDDNLTMWQKTRKAWRTTLRTQYS